MKIKGINHMVLLTNDMEKTVRFYRDLLGFQLVAAVGNVPGGYPHRHYFFEVGADTTLAFMEWPGMLEEFHKPAGRTRARPDTVRPRLLRRGGRE